MATLTETSVGPRTYPTTTAGPTAGTLQLRGGDLCATPIVRYDQGTVFGAEVSGIDWSKPVSPEVLKELVALQDKHGVLIFRNTGLDNAGHIAFTQLLGKDLEVNPFFYGREKDRLGEPLLWDVGNIELDGSIVQPSSRRWHHSRGNALWHTQRSKYSLLLSHGNPVVGGSWTHFADTRQAYADLPEETKARLEDLVIEHDLWHSRALAAPDVFTAPLPSELAAKPPAFHRLVQRGPDGRKVLYLAAHAKLVVGWGLEESQKLIWELIHHCTQPKYVFSMEWMGAGDMVWWDNRQSMHRSNLYTPTMTARDVRRTTVIDDGPLAWGVPKEER
ncbi:uncharacterized protein EHS24_001539 [Apiotrichum porosum]|uniref:TauD/TfdA-like domain-containing protein n=1 Tax=Apiotrichum porosum TaxID=105984 RepID=A0A427XL78_9TREE|nr:uncharacterized protein EHS24_001539 [Apiotrichum porosum]RSH79487.1 hypothetical protein EHS24_001539 [Apiotrichum porosum]